MFPNKTYLKRRVGSKRTHASIPFYTSTFPFVGKIDIKYSLIAVIEGQR